MTAGATALRRGADPSRSGVDLSPAQRFAALSLATMLALGLLLGTFLSRLIEERITRTTADGLGQQVESLVRHQLSADDLATPMTGERYERFSAFLRDTLLTSRIARVKIWDRDGRVVYADDAAIVGRTYPLTGDLREAVTTGRAVAHVELGRTEHGSEAGLGPLLEVYVPLVPRDASAILGAYEVYFHYSAIAAEIRDAQVTVWSALAAAFGVLWVSLYWVYARASRALALSEAARRRLALLAMLNEISVETGAVRSEEDLLRRAVDAVQRQFGYDIVTISLLDREAEALVVTAIAGGAAESLLGAPHLPLGAGITGHVAQDGRPYLAADTAADRRYVPIPGLPMRSELAVPLRNEGKVLGVLNAESRRRGAFQEDDRVAMETLGSQLGMALTNMRLYEETSRLAVTDGLTGIANRRRFDELLAHEVRRASRYARPLALMMIDVDRFKRVNDRYGHASGDRVLRALAGLLAADVRETDTLARYGGEEFAVLLPETRVVAAIQVAEKLRAAVAATLTAGDPPLPITVSVGVAAVEHAGRARDDADVTARCAALLAAADRALYAAKRAGRDRVCAGAEVAP